jgi:hypothetical protein
MDFFELLSAVGDFTDEEEPVFFVEVVDGVEIAVGDVIFFIFAEEPEAFSTPFLGAGELRADDDNGDSGPRTTRSVAGGVTKKEISKKQSDAQASTYR